MRIVNSFALTSLAGLALSLSTVACFSDPSGPGSGSPGGSVGPRPTTCAIPEGGSPPPIAPNGYYTNGSQVCTAAGQPHIFRGVDRPSLEFSSTGDHISPQDFEAIAQWNANVVRIATNQDFWLPGAVNTYDPGYQGLIQDAVTWAEEEGLEVILDLHWSDRGDILVQSQNTGADTPGYGQQQMADVNSVEFWKEVATTFKDDGHVFFELYNEPNGISWDVWLNGGNVTGKDPYTAHGMQELYDTVRATGANNLVIVGGIDFAFDLSGVASTPVQGYNIMYATHPYPSNDSMGEWASAFEYLSIGNIAPVIATEFGDGSMNCTGNWDQSLINVAAQPNVHMSWTAWAWYPGGCSFPSLIDGFGTYNPTIQGQVVQAALLAANPIPTSLLPDAGEDGGTADGSIFDATIGDASGDGSSSDGTTSDATSNEASAESDGSGADGTSSADDGASDDAGAE